MSKLWTPSRWQANQTRVRPGYEWAWRGLRFAHVGDWSPTWTRPGSFFGSTRFDTSARYGRVIDSDRNGGVYYPLGSLANDSGTTQTVVVLAYIDSYDNWGSLFKVPYRDDNTWTDPFNSISFHRQFNTDSAGFTITSGGTDYGKSSDTGYIDLDAWRMYTVRRDGSTYHWYKDDEFFSSVSNGSSGAIDWGDSAPIHIGERNHKITGEGITGQFALVLYYDRFLHQSEIQSLFHDPFGAFVAPDPIILRQPSSPLNRPIGAAVESELAAVIAGGSIFSAYPTGDGSIVDVLNESDSASPLWSSVDDDPASPTDTDWINDA